VQALLDAGADVTVKTGMVELRSLQQQLEGIV